MKAEEIKKVVREGYGRVAARQSSCCGPKNVADASTKVAESISKKMGYTDEELKSVPDGANLGLGCGNPTALASLKEGETVLDLGSGGGFDCFLAARKVGQQGKVIGVDMTAEMLEKARENARKGNYSNVEFRLGEIEHLPVADNSVDVIISNCVINLSPDKGQVFKEVYRVLKPGGRLMVSDIVLLQELPEELKHSKSAYVSCIAGALMKETYLGAIKDAGFDKVTIVDETKMPFGSQSNDPMAKAVIEDLNIPLEKLKKVAESVVSIKVESKKSL
jgi:SAM-dependent methyltransferase